MHKVGFPRKLGKNLVTDQDPAPATPPSPVPRPPFGEGWDRLCRLAPDGGGRWLLVDVAAQRLHLMAGRSSLQDWPVSTAAAGLDAREGSGGTPPGVHRISRRIGGDAPPGMVFISREPTGLVWPHALARPDDAPGEPLPDDLILSRVLTLEGLEDGVNRGPGVDSTARYIYLHGTNAEERLGTPCSHGCVRLANADVIALFDLVREGDPVVIV
jgi:hypothetical protein